MVYIFMHGSTKKRGCNNLEWKEDLKRPKETIGLSDDFVVWRNKREPFLIILHGKRHYTFKKQSTNRFLQVLWPNST